MTTKMTTKDATWVISSPAQDITEFNLHIYLQNYYIESNYSHVMIDKKN